MSSQDFLKYCSSFFKGLADSFELEFCGVCVAGRLENVTKDVKKIRAVRKFLEDGTKDFLRQGKDFFQKIHQNQADFEDPLPVDYKKTLGHCFSDFEKQLRAISEPIFSNVDQLEISIYKKQYTAFENIPTKSVSFGGLHPLEKTMQDCLIYFEKCGFLRVEGSEIEDEYHNFEALGIASDHPARDSQDSFYIQGGEFLLRTQTSPVQIRIMETCKPPIAIVSAGRVFRRDATDASHLSHFYQMEGLLVNVGVNFIQLKAILQDFLQHLFGEHLSVRFRPDYFPFTEPSCEASVRCPFCYEKETENCTTCRGNKWVEILGAGMVHPNVLRKVGIDPNKFSGFAFGCGIERIAMVVNSIRDIRHFYENDVDFLYAD